MQGAIGTWNWPPPTAFWYPLSIHPPPVGNVAIVNVAYVIAARFELTEKAGPDDNAGKHLDVFGRRARKGQCFHQPCLGTREFPARFSLLEAATLPPPIDETRDLGFMLWDIDHANDHASLFFRARLENGIMTVPPPGSPEIRR